MFSSRSLGFILCFAVFLFLILFFVAQKTSQNTIVKEFSISTGKKYKHFKGHEYVVVCIARDTEDKNIREMVVYQDLHDANKIWVRPLAMFKEPVDKVKYPDVAQKYRFEEIVDMEVPVSLSEIDSKSSDGTISSGKKYRHFKGNEYVVVCIARDTEDKDIREMVVYQDLHDANKIWVRPLAMYKEKVDKIKYPEIKQTYTFAEILG